MRPRRSAAAAAVLALSAGCWTGRPPVPDETIAVLAPGADVYIDRIDGVAGRLAFRGMPQDLAAGSHTVIVRHRIELPIGTSHTPPDHPLRLGADAVGMVGYVSESTCSLTFEAHSGARYAVRIEERGAATPWVGMLSGSGADVSCTAVDPVPRELVGQTRYLCCTMAFSGGEATDANYLYGDAALRLPAGAPVLVTEVDRNRVTFRSAADDETYDLYFAYGRHLADDRTYFYKIFLERDPTATLAGEPAAIRSAVEAGRAMPGMTTEQTIMARGYPPLHRTPDLAAREWLYYDGPGNGVYVTFADGAIKSVRNGPAP